MTVFGYREWHVHGSKQKVRGRGYGWEDDDAEFERVKGKLLSPIHGNVIWPPVMVSRCTQSNMWRQHLEDLGVDTTDLNPYRLAKLVRRHSDAFRPIAECRCGLYCYANDSGVGYTGSNHNSIVYGAIQLGGKIIPSANERGRTTGYRAEQARVAVLVHSAPPKLRHELTADYADIPIVKTWKEARAICRAN